MKLQKGDGASLERALDLEGVTAAVVGPFTMEQAIQNVELARKYRLLGAEYRDKLARSWRRSSESGAARSSPRPHRAS